MTPVMGRTRDDCQLTIESIYCCSQTIKFNIKKTVLNKSIFLFTYHVQNWMELPSVINNNKSSDKKKK